MCEFTDMTFSRDSMGRMTTQRKIRLNFLQIVFHKYCKIGKVNVIDLVVIFFYKGHKMNCHFDSK